MYLLCIIKNLLLQIKIEKFHFVTLYDWDLLPYLQNYFSRVLFVCFLSYCKETSLILL